MSGKNQICGSNAKPANRLEKVEKQFENWRKMRKKREKIPDHLWVAAVSLSKDYPLSRIAVQLHLDYTKLKQKISNTTYINIKDSSYQQQIEKKKPITFLDVDLNSEHLSFIDSGSDPWIIELQKPDMTSMKLSIPGRQLNFSELLATFFSSKV